ncbi:ROK family protein [Novosphingobium tardum]|uniref:fructokinase n=1 Tax=Novosphingobium tardum TaxID=1538021 RepID=A0ABV8RNJ1_9SPHN
MQTDKTYAGLELGGTKILAATWRSGTIVDQISVPTGTPDASLPETMAWLTARIPTNGFAGLGIASFGPIRVDPSASDYGRILETTKPGWSGIDLVAEVVPRFACPFLVDTDVNGAALAEWHWGAARGCASVVYLTIGTGVGGGVLIDGIPVHGRLHPELGHLRLRRAQGDTFAGSCSFHGDCIEGLISGPALAARLGRDPREVPHTDAVWDRAANDLAELLGAIILALSPQRILVGGGVGLGQPHLREAAVRRVSALLGHYLRDFDEAALAGIVVAPALGAQAGPLGAIALALNAADQRRAPDR